MNKFNESNQILVENDVIKVALSSVIGDREDQQDSFGYELRKKEGIVLICDGMGGHEGGQLASNLVTNYIVEKYREMDSSDITPHDFLIDMVNESDDLVASLKDDEGKWMKAGSTIVGIIVDTNKLFWVSVGDSRIYILRKEEFVQITTDHIYKNHLIEQLKNGIISQREYNEGIAEGEVLVSFLGRGELPYIDANDIPFEVQSGDKILLMSDGLYKILSDEEIYKILINFENADDAVAALEMKACKKCREISRDNTTIALIYIK